MHQVLESDNSDKALLIHDRNDTEVARGELPKCRSQRLLFYCYLENPVHRSLNITIAVDAQGVENFLLRNNADHVTAAHDREIILQSVYGFFEGIFQRVGRRKRG